MSTRKVKEAIDLETNEVVYFKGHAQATYMSDGRTVEDAINQAGTGGGGITNETDPIFSSSPAASITEEKKAEWDNKVDKINGKQLSTEDFTTLLKQKLEGLSNYDDTTISQAVQSLQTQLNTLVSGDTTSAIESFNEIVAFLEGVQDSGTLEGIVAGVNQEIAKKQDKISDLETIRLGAAKGATALQSYTEKYTGTYSKPSGGIPKTDLASAVQTSLGKADTALQSYTEKYTGTYSKPSGGIPKSDLASAVQTSLGKADTALQGFTETDPVFSASAAAGIKSSDITNWNSKTSNTGTITGIKMNGASKGTSGVVDLGTVITEHQDISGKINGDGTITNIVKVSSLPSSPNANTLYVIV